MKTFDRRIGLYIHIPFCKAKCYYCDFNSFACKEDYIPPYFDALKKEIALYSSSLKDYSIKTVFIGGGTPSSVRNRYIYEILNFCNQNFNIEKDAEISIETNPGTLSYEKLMAYRILGINRLSIGLQAWQNRLLKSLGRIHTNKEFEDNFEQARKAGFKNINVDLIFGLPQQTIKDWDETLSKVLELQPEHISCYSLKIEDNTAFGNMLEIGELIPAEDELDREMYYLGIKRLNEAGFEHYEISNFSKPGYQCRHNMIYWEAEQYIGLGAGAHSYFLKKRYNNEGDIGEYIKVVTDHGLMPADEQEIDAQEEIYEFIILGLRLTWGICTNEFKERFGKDIFQLFSTQINKLLNNRLIEIVEGHIRLSSKGLDLANEVFVEFMGE